jgi:hypothetical protein
VRVCRPIALPLMLVVAAVLGPATRAAAADAPLSGLLVDLLYRSVVMQSTTTTVAGNPHEAHFLPSLAQTQAPFELNKALVSQLATFPIGSSSGGFTYSFDSRTRAFSRTSQTFGPSFAERALTNGKGRFSAGFNYQRASYDKFEGTDLNSSDFSGPTFFLRHNDCCPGQNTAGAPGGGGGEVNPAFEGDIVQIALSLDAVSTTTAFFVNYGVTDRLDVGLTVPIVHVSLDATERSTVDRLATASNPLIHSWDGQGASTKTETRSGSATGIGDLLVRAKYNFFQAEGGGVAGGLDLRLPTGDDKNLLGTGATQVKLQLIASGAFGRLSPHANFGYTFSSGSLDPVIATLSEPADLPGTGSYYTNVLPNGYQTVADLSVPDEINYVFGTEIEAHPRLTLAGDIVGRSLRDVQRFGVVSQTFDYRTINGGPVQTASFDALDITSRGALNLLLGVVTAKYNVPNTTLLITGSVLFPLTDDGLKPGVTPVIGLDYGLGH